MANKITLRRKLKQIQQAIENYNEPVVPIHQVPSQNVPTVVRREPRTTAGRVAQAYGASDALVQAVDIAQLGNVLRNGGKL